MFGLSFNYSGIPIIIIINYLDCMTLSYQPTQVIAGVDKINVNVD